MGGGEEDLTHPSPSWVKNCVAGDAPGGISWNFFSTATTCSLRALVVVGVQVTAGKMSFHADPVSGSGACDADTLPGFELGAWSCSAPAFLDAEDPTGESASACARPDEVAGSGAASLTPWGCGVWTCGPATPAELGHWDVSGSTEYTPSTKHRRHVEASTPPRSGWSSVAGMGNGAGTQEPQGQTGQLPGGGEGAHRRPRRPWRKHCRTLCFKDKRNAGIAAARRVWAALLQRQANPTSHLLERLGDVRGEAHLGNMLRRWGHSTVLRHGRAAAKFFDWIRHREGQ